MPRLGLGLVIGLALVGATPWAGSASVDRETRWNVVLIMAEDLSPRLGAYGDAVARTPNLDRLAREGMRFTHAFTTAGVCAPSRAAIIMGVHQNTWGAGHMRAHAGGYAAVPPPHMKAFPELLRAAGYHAVNNGKTDYQMGGGSFGAVFGGPSTIWDESRVEDWRGRDAGQPFFAYLNLGHTHESQVWPTWQLRGGVAGLVALAMRVPNHWAWPSQTDPGVVPVPPYYPDTETVRADIARHYNNLEHMDAVVGGILAKLEADGVADRTVVIFTTDHGDGLPRAKRWPYDSGVHVPLLVRWPGVIPPGSVSEELASGVDLAPTILSIAGVPVPDWMHGRVLVGPGRQPEPRYVYAARDRIDEASDGVRAVRDRRFQYLRHLHPEQPYVLDVAYRNLMPMMREMLELHAQGRLEGSAALWFRDRRDPEELYDTDSDPHQVRNLAADPAYRGVLERLRAELDRWLAESGDLGLLPEAELAERFWPGGEQPVTPEPTLTLGADGEVVVRGASEGTSLAVCVDDGAWKLYTAPLQVRDATRVSAKAVRYGWAESDEVELRLP